MFNFEKLDAWQLAIEFAGVVYQAAHAFPDYERFGLRSQIQRSAVSISANLAEGSGRASSKEFIRFVEISFGSLMETVSHATIAKRQKFLGDDEYQTIYERAERLGRMLSGLRNSLLRKGE